MEDKDVTTGGNIVADILSTSWNILRLVVAPLGIVAVAFVVAVAVVDDDDFVCCLPSSADVYDEMEEYVSKEGIEVVDI